MSQTTFPYQDEFTLGRHTLSAAQIIELLTSRISQERRDAIRSVIDQRTYSIACVCDGLYDTGNVAAVMRSAEAMGIQPFHVVSPQTRLKRSKRITAGTDKWLDITRWTTPGECIGALRERGYRIVATQLADDCVPISEIDFTQEPTAIVFGNEHAGVSQEFLEASDIRCIIPMRGFAESFNISVAAALSFYHIAQDRLARQGFHGDLNEAQREILEAHFYMRSLGPRARTLITGLLSRQQGA